MVPCVSILSASNSLEKNTGSGRDDIRFRDQNTDVYKIYACYKSIKGLIS